MRPICPLCNQEMVFVAIVVAGTEVFYRTYTCDCLYEDGEMVPADLIDEIRDTRQQGPDASLCIVQEPPEGWIPPHLDHSLS